MKAAPAEDDDQTVNNDTAPSTPNSSSNTAQNGSSKSTIAVKDRPCPFCGQAFTSSSLGRHLDLYIRPKNPKPADGVHDVEEIQKLRGGITRRQPRTSGRAVAGSASRSGSNSHGHSRQQSAGLVQDAQGEDDDDSSARPVTRDEQHAPAPVESVERGSGHAKAVRGPAPTPINWQATGVINNLPPRASSRNATPLPAAVGQAQRVQDMRRDEGGTKISRPAYETEGAIKLQEEAEMGRAAEMALREVLGSLEAAAKRVEPKVLYDEFDFFSLSFPGLCLAILPPPGTLFSPVPFASAESWTLGSPGRRQFETMVRLLNERVAQRRKQDSVPDSLAFKYHAHLSAAWEHFEGMAEQDRASSWQLEVLRSFTRSQERNSELRSELERSQQRVHHLETEYDRLSRCQLPREYLTHPPNTIPIPSAVMKEMRSSNLTSGAAEANYNAEELINQWRYTIRATTRQSRAVVSQPSPSHHNHKQSIYADPSSGNNLESDIVLNSSIWHVGGPLPRAVNPHRGETHHENVSYQTPPNPGAVVGAANTDDDTTTPQNDADADGEEEDYPSGGHYGGEQNALMKRPRIDGSLRHVMHSPKQSSQSQQDVGTTGLNGNGKRPLGAHSGGGRSSTRILKER